MANQQHQVEKREDLLFRLGEIVRPLKELVYAMEEPERFVVIKVRQDLEHDISMYENTLAQYFYVDGLYLDSMWQDVKEEICRLSQFLHSIEYKSDPHLKENYESTIDRLKKKIRAVPLGIPEDISKAESPFSTYLKLRNLFASAQTSLELFEPYLYTSHFYRYFYEVEEQCNITVVTDSGIKEKHTRYNQVESVAELFKKERQDKFHLRLGDLHGRYLRIDCNQTIHLSDSLNKAGIRTFFSFSPVNDTNTLSELDQVLAKSQKWL